jgi:hypothetical protein
MLRLRATLACVLLLAPAVAQCQSDAAPWRFVPPNAKALININWQRIRQSPAVAMIRDKWLNVGPKAAIPGIEFLDEIDRVVISSPGNETSKDADASADVEPRPAPFLFAVDGHFDAAKVRKFFARLGAKPQAYNAFQVYRPQARNAKNMAYVLFDAGTILFGDAPLVFAALDRNQFGAPTPAPGSIVARAAESDQAYELWLVVTSPDILSDDRLEGLFRAGEWAPDAQEFEVGLHLRAGLTADVTVRFASAETAKHVVTEMTRLAGIAAKDKDDLQMQDIVRKLKFSSDGSAAKITLRLTQQELAKSTQALMAAHPAAGEEPVATPTPGATTRRATTAVPAPEKPGVIRSEGLDDGPRVIPVPDHQN